jgi:hypothetical protein
MPSVAGAEVQQVEGVQLDRYPGQQPGAGGADVHALLQQAEAGPALRVEGDDLAVDDDLAAGKAVEQRAEFRVPVGHVTVVSGGHPQPAAIGVHDGAHAVPFEFVCPARWRR